jgi:hypothetical protein
MAASRIPSFAPQFPLSQLQIQPTPYLRGQASPSAQLSIIGAKIQDIMTHLEFPTYEDKAQSLGKRLKQMKAVSSPTYRDHHLKNCF